MLSQEVLSQEAVTTGALPRRLSLPSTVAVIVGVIVGSGIFRAPSSVAEAAGSASAIMFVWVAGGVVTLCLALCVAELGTMFPRAGGAYVYLRESFGPAIGSAASFAYGWTYLVIITPSAWATIAMVFAEYCGAFVTLDATGTRIVATAAITFVTLANVVSVRLAAGIQNIATSAKMLALAGIVAVLFGFGDGTHGAFATDVSARAMTLGGFVVGLVTALWAYDGVVPASSVFGEVRDPERTLPRALMVGVFAVTAIYLAMNVALLYVLPVNVVAASKLVAADAMRAVAGQAGASLVAAAVMLTTFGALAATALCDPRVIFAMAADGQFFRAVAKVHPRFETPYVAVILCWVLAIVWVWARNLEQLAAQFVLGLWPFYALMVLGLLRLRVTRRQADRPYRVPLYPLVPLACIAGSLVLLIGSFIELPNVSLVNLSIIVLAFPIYLAWRVTSARKAQRMGRSVA
jgi:APA family basic amino acid/polyamine antiporter